MEPSGPLPQPPRNSDEMYAFEVGAQSVFSAWNALIMAVEHEFGGSRSRDKAQALFEDFLDLFYRKRELSDPEKLWEWLDEQLEARLHMEMHDDSTEKVLEMIYRVYEACVLHNWGFLNQVLSANCVRRTDDPIWGGKKVTQWPPKENKAPRTKPIVPLDDVEMEDASGSDDGDSDEDDDMDEDDEKPPNDERPKEEERKPDPENDGWTTIGKKGKKGR